MRGFFFSDSDHRARIRVSATGPAKNLMLTFEIDTGASGQIYINQELANDLGLEIIDNDLTATLADGRKEPVFLARLQIHWMDEQRFVDATVWTSPTAPIPPFYRLCEPQGCPD
jgi:predicted aspartyl protease